MMNWKTWVFCVVMGMTLVLLWKAIDNIQSTPTIQLDSNELYQQIEDDNIAFFQFNADGSANGRLRSGEFFSLNSVVDRPDLLMQLEKRDVDLKFVESRGEEFLKNTIPGFIAIGLCAFFFVRKWQRNRNKPGNTSAG